MNNKVAQFFSQMKSGDLFSDKSSKITGGVLIIFAELIFMYVYYETIKYPETTPWDYIVISFFLTAVAVAMGIGMFFFGLNVFNVPSAEVAIEKSKKIAWITGWAIVPTHIIMALVKIFTS